MQARKLQASRSSTSVVRQSLTLPAAVARRVKKLADSRRLSANQVLVELVEAGIEAKEREKSKFMALAEELSQTKSLRRQTEIKEELARLTFGE